MDQVRSSPFTFGSVTYDLSGRTFIMGILNVTPDSFSDGGRYVDAGNAVDHALKMIEDGADFIDIGGESTRPGSAPLPAGEEIRRVIPVIEKLSSECDTPISIDTYKSEVAEAALDAGAIIVNDITGLHHDEGMPEIIAKYSASAILMHIKGTPKTMQVNPQYDNVVEEIISYLRKSIAFAQSACIDQIIVDPGIGFGKTLEHNLLIIQQLKKFQQLNCPVMVGPSRKSFIGTILDLPVEERLEGTAAVVAASIMNGANIVRVHDVKEMKRVAMVTDRIIRGS
jgi:dihydropteroate synthase